ncbi:NACHT domain-containing protein [Leptolyngbya sp. FACHB-541]|uniref:NACHT domain-containing protein n=1 Tax=Leptolyngbya sp. FACHB-541 TaxID=2692810 RepID=UPI00168333CC|nr:NACHT domain-containing protein [Leptolyngbya sp. FACHB-541]MBD1998821.1 NACHT domain-containing protein [Leptolyngbya sp. FACHB-541]
MTGLEPFLLEAAKGLTGLVIKAGWEMANIPIDKPAKQLIFRASQQYVRSYTERHGILKVLGMREPIPLESVYVAVQCLDNATLQGYESIEGLEQAYRESKRRQFGFREPSKQPGLTIANQKQYLMVLGGPGMGKSTFLRKMGLEALKGRRREGFHHPCLPVFVELKLFRAGEIDIRSAIAHEFATCGFPDHERFTNTMLEQGRLLILLDGLDEVPTDRMSDAITKIQDFVDLHDKNRFIASCRVAAYRHNFRRFTDVAIADFDDDQIQAFIANWFHSQPKLGQECWEKLTSAEYAAAKELTHTPLLLTLACLLYQRAGQFPTNRATLYERALRVLLEEWAAEKELPRDSFYKGLDTKRKKLMLSEIAYEAFKEDRLFLSKREVVEQIERSLKDMLPDEKFIDGAAVLRSIEVQHGVLVERAEGIYSFSHLTLQEFLTAQHIVEDHRQVEQLVVDYLSDERWREVFLLLAGLKKADDLLVKMQQQAQTYLTPKLQELLRWADWITTGSEGNYDPVAKRAAAIYFTRARARARALGLARARALNLAFALALNLDRALALDLDHDLNLDRDLNLDLNLARTLDLDLARALNLAKIFKNVNFKSLVAKLEVLRARFSNRKLSGEEALNLAKDIQKLWFDALHLNPELVNLSEAEVETLTTYLNANLLLVECRQSAVRVSTAVWEAIEAQMLRA